VGLERRRRCVDGCPAHPLLLLSCRMRSMTPMCHSCVPWHMLRRATFMPLDARLSRTPGEHDAGPMVHISFVRRVLRKPVERVCARHSGLQACPGMPDADARTSVHGRAVTPRVPV